MNFISIKSYTDTVHLYFINVYLQITISAGCLYLTASHEFKNNFLPKWLAKKYNNNNFFD